MPETALDGSITLTTKKGTLTTVLPICLDWQKNLDSFLSDRLPSEDVLFGRWIKPNVVNPLVCDNGPEILRPPYPPLPPIKINELQWPTGASRYGRALYLVDWATLRKVAEDCWGYEVPKVGDKDILPTDVPEKWWKPGEAPKCDALELTINSTAAGANRVWRSKMLPLPPYRVPGSSIALWLLPLVDLRFRCVHAVTPNIRDKPEDWKELLTDLVDDMGMAIVKPPATLGDPPTKEVDITGTISKKYGEPDPRYYDTHQNQLSCLLFDTAVLSIGFRAIFEPATGKLRVIDQATSSKRRDKTLGFNVHLTTGEVSGSSDPLLIAGGKRGRGMVPAAIDVYCQRAGKVSKKSKTLSTDDGATSDLFRLPIWTTWESRPDGPAPTPPDGRTGSPFSYFPTVPGGSGSYSATGLPPGLSISAGTGEISGTPTTEGTYDVTVTQGPASVDLTITIELDNTKKTNNFVDQVAADLIAWSNCGGQYCFAGTFDYLPNGYDDFASVQIFEAEPGRYVFRTRIYELPPLFLPDVIVAGGEPPSCRAGELYRFELTETIGNGDGGETGKTTKIYSFDKTVSISGQAILVNVDGMIDGAGPTFVGECKYEAGKYWFVQGKCGQICKSVVSLPFQTPTNAKIGQTDYSWTPTLEGGSASGWSASGLPPGFSINGTTGAITGPTVSPGVVGPERSAEITVNATVPKVGGGTCTISRKMTLKITGA
jgi:hypothetical protein